MKTNSITIFLACFFIFTSCSGDKTEQEAMYNKVMEVHDEVMPEMGNLMKLTKRLKLELDSLTSNEVENQTEEIIKVNGLITDLESANESMMQWMRNFEPLEEGTAHGEVMNFLLEEKKKVDKVKKDMLSAKDNAEKYFLKNQ